MLLVLLATCPTPQIAAPNPLLDFSRRPDGAVQLVGAESHRMVSESGGPIRWTFEGGVLTAPEGWDSLLTPEPYGDFRMHVEFAVNSSDDENRETHGNSGVYLQQRYEIQILDSASVPHRDYQVFDCGSLYRFKKPDLPACRPAGEWQSYDILFRAARFEGERKVEDVRITVFQNDALIHENVALTRKTGAGKPEGPEPLPIKLQGHNNPVRFRNVWIEALDLDSLPAVPGDDPRRPRKALPMDGEVFTVDGCKAFVIEPEESDRRDGPMPWVWYAPTLPRLPGDAEKWMFERFLSAGVAIAGVDVGESYGCPSGVRVYDAFHGHLRSKRGYADRPCLLARSRGGLMLYAWAATQPEKVAGIAGVYPVCDLASYPGLEKAAPAYGLDAAGLAASLSDHNPIERLAALAEARVPVRHIHGDSDEVVPLDANSGALAKRYTALGGPVELEVVRGRGHDMWRGWFESELLTEFVIERARIGASGPR